MKKWNGFILVVFALIMSVALPVSASRYVLPVENDVGYVLSIDQDIIDISIAAIDYAVAPEFTRETHCVLKYSVVSPVVCSSDIELGAGISCNAAVLYNYFASNGENRYSTSHGYFPNRSTSQNYRDYETDYEGLYRLDIGECLWRI